MITDEQGREWLLKKLYDDGWRYYVMDKYKNIYLTNENPYKFNDTGEIMLSSCEKAIGITAINMIFPELNCNECISIAEELGIVDWSKVKVDTPILVREMDGCPWKKRYFAFFDGRIVQAWRYGATSWSIENKRDTISWPYAKLAEV